MPLITGTIARLVNDKGFGFIRRNDGLEYFFHKSALQGGVFEDLHEGQFIKFEEALTTVKGPRANRVIVE